MPPRRIISRTVATWFKLELETKEKRAIDEGLQSGPATREEVFAILEGAE